MSLKPCLVLLDKREWPADPIERRDSFDARLRYAFAHRKSLQSLVAELQSLADLYASPELRDLLRKCLRAVATVNAHDGSSFDLLRAVHGAIFVRR